MRGFALRVQVGSTPHPAMGPTEDDCRYIKVQSIFRGYYLGWPLKPFEKYWYVGSLIKAIRENTKYPRGLPSY